MLQRHPMYNDVETHDSGADPRMRGQTELLFRHERPCTQMLRRLIHLQTQFASRMQSQTGATRTATESSLCTPSTQYLQPG